MRYRFFALIAAALLGLLLSQCRKSQDKLQLLRETQTGAGTFGCLVDGKVFRPKGSAFAGPIWKAFNQYVDGRYIFGISARRSEGEVSQLVSIGGDSITLSKKTYELGSREIKGVLYGQYNYSEIGTLRTRSFTNSIHKGQLTVKHFDSVAQIVSGTFWFDAIDSATGRVVQIRDGRFDLTYVR